MKHLHKISAPKRAVIRDDQGQFMDALEEFMQVVLGIGRVVASGKDDKNFAF
jgi:hypothetical protein